MATVPQMSSSRSAPAWRTKLGAFWRWWVDEIGQLLPERFAHMRGAGRVPVVAVTDSEVVLVEPRSAVGPETRLELGTLDETRRRGALRALLERAGEKRARARICLEPGEALVRRVTMPAATEENLSQVLGFEMDRLTPFRADEVYFDHRVVSRDAAAGQLDVQLAVARRALVDARVAQMRALGASVQGVTVREDASHPHAPLDLLPLEQRGERESPNERLIQGGLVALVVLLLATALVFPLYRKREAIVAMLPMVAKARTDAESTDALARELERTAADYNFLLAKKHTSYPALAYVEEVTRLLPDNTWLQQLDIRPVGKAREVQISGETTSSSKLIEILEQSRLMQNAAPRGTVTRGSQPNTERFMIAAEARARPLPEATPVLDIPVPVPQAAPAAPPASPTPTSPTPAAAAPAAPATAKVTPIPPGTPAAPPPPPPGVARKITKPAPNP
jgi:general secretion pathway protein L